MKRSGNLKDSFLSFENLYVGYKKAFKATKNYSACEFTFNVDRELHLLRDELACASYVPREYRYFVIKDPKERRISVAAFRDRVVHHSLVNILEPVFEKRFIYDSYATRKCKGTHRAIARAQHFIKQNRWYLKMDVRKYFDSINHEVLNSIIGRSVKDTFILKLCAGIIAKGGNGCTGLPIGNLTSQFFANVYLDVFDHFIKERNRIKYYLRYMDDFCIFSNDKIFLKEMKIIVIEYLKAVLNLEIKDSAVLLNSSLHGLPFLGVRIFPNMIRYKKENFKRGFIKLKEREREYSNGMIDYIRYSSSMQSLTAYLTHYGKGLLKSRLYGVNIN